MAPDYIAHTITEGQPVKFVEWNQWTTGWFGNQPSEHSFFCKFCQILSKSAFKVHIFKISKKYDKLASTNIQADINSKAKLEDFP